MIVGAQSKHLVTDLGVFDREYDEQSCYQTQQKLQLSRVQI